MPETTAAKFMPTPNNSSGGGEVHIHRRKGHGSRQRCLTDGSWKFPNFEGMEVQRVDFW